MTKEKEKTKYMKMKEAALREGYLKPKNKKEKEIVHNDKKRNIKDK